MDSRKVDLAYALLIAIRQEFGHCCRWHRLSRMAAFSQIGDFDGLGCMNDRFSQITGAASCTMLPVAMYPRQVNFPLKVGYRSRYAATGVGDATRLAPFS